METIVQYGRLLEPNKHEIRWDIRSFTAYDSAGQLAILDAILAGLPDSATLAEHNNAVEEWAFAAAEKCRLPGLGVQGAPPGHEVDDRAHDWLDQAAKLMDSAQYDDTAEFLAFKFPAILAAARLNESTKSLIVHLTEADKRLRLNEDANGPRTYSSVRDCQEAQADATYDAWRLAALAAPIEHGKTEPSAELLAEIDQIYTAVGERKEGDDYYYNPAYDRAYAAAAARAKKSFTDPATITEEAVQEELLVVWQALADAADRLR